MEPELVADYQCVTGEGPLWHPDEERLYWVDIPTGRMFRYDPATGAHEQVYQGAKIGGFTVQANGALLLFKERGAIKTWRQGEVTTIVEEIPAERHTRFNDVIADPAGRVFCGTIQPRHEYARKPAPDEPPDLASRPAHLYRLDTDGALTTLLDDVHVSNGMGFTPDLSGLYYTDSAKHEIYRFDYDQESGAISNRRVWVRTPEGPTSPDGLTVDAEGYVWSAMWGGGCVVRYAPDGTVVQQLELPVKKVTSVTFGGRDYADLYVTTGGGDNRAREGAGAGALYRFRPGVQGVPEFPSRVGL